MKAILPIRGNDPHGSGEWGASRGARKHKGIDFEVPPESKILAIKAGTVTKLGYAYPDDLSWRYVQVTDAQGLQWRYFYLKPLVSMGDKVEIDDIIGSVQDLTARYDGITPHCHLEVKRNGVKINPLTVMK